MFEPLLEKGSSNFLVTAGQLLFVDHQAASRRLTWHRRLAKSNQDCYSREERCPDTYSILGRKGLEHAYRSKIEIDRFGIFHARRSSLRPLFQDKLWACSGSNGLCERMANSSTRHLRTTPQFIPTLLGSSSASRCPKASRRWIIDLQEARVRTGNCNCIPVEVPASLTFRGRH
jgi:hypothetical protein